MIAVGFGYWHNGYRAYVIHTGSMAPALVPGDLIIDKPAAGDYHPGDIVTFRHSAGPDLVTHRVASISAGVIHTKGDANESADVWNIAPSMVQGSLQWRLPYMGYVAVYFQHPLGLASLVTIALGLILLWQLFFSSSPQARAPVPVAGSGRRHRPGLEPAPGVAGRRWRTDGPANLPVTEIPTVRSRPGRRAGGNRHASPGPDISSPTELPVGRHGVASAVPVPTARHRARTATPEIFSPS
jgi:signal peptidase